MKNILNYQAKRNVLHKPDEAHFELSSEGKCSS
ncbi:hypothetical protein J2S19_002450 [Metabacillus malikii]|uniref:Uncharacterized protein n=1 Tax=Metabacillus malikii TaxID=1504265 RepID=A0ABT9ZFY7_9BACI|nr:hypothetical protein [Metabacillus malikii]